jgi:RND superfamily putative drug exporter
MLDRHLIPHFGQRQLAELEAQPELIDAYIALKRTQGLAPKTIQNHLLLLNLMLRRATAWRLIRTNPLANVDRPRLEHPEINVLNETEISRLLAAYDQLITQGAPDQRHWWHLANAIVVTALGTAMRRGELLGLRWRAVDLLEGKVHVREAHIRGQTTTPKSRASRRVIELGPRTRAALATTKAACRLRYATTVNSSTSPANPPRDETATSGTDARPSASGHRCRHQRATQSAEPQTTSTTSAGPSSPCWMLLTSVIVPSPIATRKSAVSASQSRRERRAGMSSSASITTSLGAPGAREHPTEVDATIDLGRPTNRPSADCSIAHRSESCRHATSRQETPMLSRLAHLTVRHRWTVIGAWFVLTLFGAFAAGKVSTRCYQSFAIPGKPAYEASQRTLTTFGAGARAPSVVVYHTSGDATRSTAIEAAMRRAAAEMPGARTTSYFSTGDLVYVSRDRHTTFQEIYPPGETRLDAKSGAEEMRAAAARGLPASITVNVTGHDPLDEATTHESGGGTSVLLEAVIGGIGALVILLFVFGTLPAVLMPLVVAAAAILNTFTLVWALTYVTDVSLIVQFLIALVGLGIAIDYALLIIFRFRDDLRDGNDVETALVETMTHAGHSVIVSGSTVAVGLLAMIALPLPLVRSMGIGGMLIPAVSVLASLTLLPALLAVLGTRINSVRVMPRRLIDRGHPEAGAWGRWARYVLRRPLAVRAVAEPHRRGRPARCADRARHGSSRAQPAAGDGRPCWPAPARRLAQSSLTASV